MLLRVVETRWELPLAGETMPLLLPLVGPKCATPIPFPMMLPPTRLLLLAPGRASLSIPALELTPLLPSTTRMLVLGPKLAQPRDLVILELQASKFITLLEARAAATFFHGAELVEDAY
mmetsp:Transcript_7065/g.14065  ORF Transcript_7065/g.14065 Transcript_7065/m.14065 type:complete len:119 (-) Transcript_7065:177-533(-)